MKIIAIVVTERNGIGVYYEDNLQGGLTAITTLATEAKQKENV